VVCEGSTNRANVCIFQFLLQLFAEGHHCCSVWCRHLVAGLSGNEKGCGWCVSLCIWCIRLVGMKRVVDGVSHCAYGAFVEEWYLSTDHVDAVVGGDLRVDVGADCLHCCLGLA
jgi:hypothetical protein